MCEGWGALPCASLELCALVGVAGGPVQSQVGQERGGPLPEVRADAGRWNLEDELSGCFSCCPPGRVEAAAGTWG